MVEKKSNSNKLLNTAIYIIGFAFMFALIFYTFGSVSEGSYARARIDSIAELPPLGDVEGSSEKSWLVKLHFLAGEFSGQTLETEHFEGPNSAYNLNIATGDVVLAIAEKHDGQLVVGIDEHFKTRKLMALTMLIIVMIALIAGIQGMKAMVALFFTLIIIFGFMSKMLLAGYSPILLAVISSIAIALINLFFIAGKTKKTLVAIAGTLSGVIMAGFFGWIASNLLVLSGYTGHESTYLQMLNAKIDLKGILVSGIIIGALGAVMDVAISIASSLQEIAIANPEYKNKDLFNSGMNIGRDIIGSMVNTLILAYTGASLSLILLFAMQREDFPLIKIMNMEFICSEIVRSLAGLFGMVLAIPITALFASFLYARKQEDKK